MKQLALTFLIFLLVPSLCLAQAAKKIPVAVNLVTNDQVGRSLAFALKEAIRGSQSFFLVDKILAENPSIVVHMVSRDDSSDEPGISSTVAFTIVYNTAKIPGEESFLLSHILRCGKYVVESCAKGTLPS